MLKVMSYVVCRRRMRGTTQGYRSFSGTFCRTAQHDLDIFYFFTAEFHTA